MLERKGLLSSAGRGVVAAVIAGLVITMAEPPMAAAGSTSPVANGVSVAAPSGGATDISARRRHYHHHYGNAAGLAFMGMMIGTVGAAIAAQQRRDAYYDYYGYGPGYYGPPPAYYGPPVYGYGPYYGRHHFYRYYPY